MNINTYRKKIFYTYAFLNRKKLYEELRCTNIGNKYILFENKGKTLLLVDFNRH